MTDADLIQRALSGDSDAFGDLIVRHQGAVQALAYHTLGSFDDARDASQETFVHAYLKLDQLRDVDRFAGWLRTIALNRCRSLRRGRKETVPLDEVSAPVDETTPCDGLLARESRESVHRALRMLTDRNRLVITLRYLGGMSYRDIAGFLDVPLSTVEGRMHRAKQELRGRLMESVEKGLEAEQLPEDFAKQVLDEALERARDAREHWDRDTFVRSCEQAMEAAARLEDDKAKMELLSMLGEAETSWFGNSSKAITDYELALKVARQDEARAKSEEAGILKDLFVAHARHGEFDSMGARAKEALEQFDALGDKENAAIATAALDLSERVPGVWLPGQKGGYAMAVFPVEQTDRGFALLDPKGVHHYTWGCPSRCAALDHLLRPRRLLGPSLEVGATWEDTIEEGANHFSWDLGKGVQLQAHTQIVSSDAVVVTPAQRFEQCLRVETRIQPRSGATSAEYTMRSFCGARTTWFAPGVGLVKLRHQDHNGNTWAIYLMRYDTKGCDSYFPTEIGATWRYRWSLGWQFQQAFEDVCRVVSHTDGRRYLSSATWATEEEPSKILQRLGEIETLEAASHDEIGEAMALEMRAQLLDEEQGDLKAACYTRLTQIYTSLGDEWRLNEARRRLQILKEEPSEQEQRQLLEGRIALARRLGDRSKIVESVSSLAWHCKDVREYSASADLFEEAARLASEEGEAREASRCIARAELAREMEVAPPDGQMRLTWGYVCIVLGSDGKLSTRYSTRATGAELASGAEGSPMIDFVWNGPYSGIDVLDDGVGASSDRTLTGSMAGCSETMRYRYTLLSKDEDQMTPAGSFGRCALVESVISTSGEDRRLGPELDRLRAFHAGTRRVWYAQGIGPVRLLHQHHNGHETDIRLVEHHIRGATDAYLPLAIDNRWRYRWTDTATGTQYEDSLRVASRGEDKWFIAFVTRATAEEGGATQS